VIPDIEERLMIFPGSGYFPTDFAADRRGTKAKVVKWYEAVLILYSSPLSVSRVPGAGVDDLTSSQMTHYQTSLY